MSEFTLKVSPDVMIRQAESVRGSISDIRQQIEHLSEIIKGTKSYWLGQAGDKHQIAFQNIKKGCDEIVARLSEHPDDLLKMAGLYSTAERQSQEQSNSLQSNILS